MRAQQLVERIESMNELKVFNFHDIDVVDSRDVAEMVGRNHNELLKSIRIYQQYLAEGNFAHGSFFIESSYMDGNNQERPSYLITKKGCDMIANKMQGKKGVLFTAAYVTAFEKMSEQLTAPARLAPEVSPNAIANLIRVTRRVMLDMGSTPQEVGAMARDVFVTWNIPVPVSLNRQIPGQMCLPGMDGAKGLTA